MADHRVRADLVGSEAGGTGLLRLGEPLAGSWGNPTGRKAVAAL